VMIVLYKTVFVQYVAVAITAKPVDNYYKRYILNPISYSNVP
jgi:hypothetical protein